ncbi:MAG: hypothetical protein MAG551_02386 [Candidatus Scalindua arabica]|uniref:PIN domain-containing protein n=1 Tax=Candidatus Scalindua arabica TaxID=1127984 RepID=A0A941W686_9BACT|nr:hypothetical protein [Candidatus Scalindua arabica]
MPGEKIFLDTNIIVYAYDVSAGEKHLIARKVMVDLWDSGNGLLSTQVLQEVFVSVTRKIQKPLDIIRTKEVVSDLMKWDIFINDSETILGAIDIHQQYQYSFWDSMILYAAINGGASTLLSEDFACGQTVLGTKIKNPFSNSLTSE